MTNVLVKLSLLISLPEMIVLGPQQCYSCVNDNSNSECNKGQKETCKDNEVCETVVSKKCKKSYKKGCKNANACKPGAQGNSGKCVFCCTGPDCDRNPEETMRGACGGAYNTSAANSRRKRQARSGDSSHESEDTSSEAGVTRPPKPDCGTH